MADQRTNLLRTASLLREAKCQAMMRDWVPRETTECSQQGSAGSQAIPTPSDLAQGLWRGDMCPAHESLEPRSVQHW